MAKDLQLQIGSRYSIATLIFFVPYALFHGPVQLIIDVWISYILFELPSNVLIRKTGAARWIGSITTMWGVAMIGMGGHCILSSLYAVLLTDSQ